MSRRRQYIDLPDSKRRDFIKWTIGLGAALGLRPWKVFEVQESIVGQAVADSASCSSVNRFVGFSHGNGGLAWCTQLWPHLGQATSTSANVAFYAPGKAVAQTAGTGDHAMMVAPDAPKFGGKKMTAYVCGVNETHMQQGVSTLGVATGVSMYAAAAALQTASPTLVPAICLATKFGVAVGAPAAATVANAAGMVDLFNSASSLAGGTLNNPADAALFEAYYKANLSLHAAAARPTMTNGIVTGKVAANLLGKNLASQLTPTAADLARYGVTAQMPAKLTSIANALITTVKAFSLNLTSHVTMPAFLDDPHGAFQNMATLTTTVQQYAKILDAFMTDCMAIPDPMCAGRKIGDNLIMAWHGDTTKDAFNRAGWPDNTSGNHNVLYVMGNGFTKAGWFGGLQADTSLSLWDPVTGKDLAAGQTNGATSASLAAPASASVLFAVAKGDARRVQDFYRGPSLGGITNAVQM